VLKFKNKFGSLRVKEHVEKSSKSVSSTTVVVSPTPSTSSATKLQKTQKRTLVTVDQQKKNTVYPNRVFL
jgi:hypothetical protein